MVGVGASGARTAGYPGRWSKSALAGLVTMAMFVGLATPAGAQPPAVSLSAPSPDGDNGWFVSSPTVTANASDLLRRIKSLNYGFAAPLTTVTYPAPYTPSVSRSAAPPSPGSFTFTATAVNGNGETATATRAISFDPDAPSVPGGPRWVDEATGALPESGSTDGNLNASWSASADATSGLRDYRVQLSETADFAVIVSERTTAERFVTFTAVDGVQFGHVYYFRVAARDVAGNVSAWSSPSNEIAVRQEPVGPALAHAPTAAAFYGQPIPISATATCAAGQSCLVRLYYRATSPSAGDGFTVVDLTRGAATALNGGDAIEWAGSIPGSVMTTTGVDYFLEATEGTAIAVFPGTTFASTSPAPGMQGTGAFWHVHTLSPPVIAHQPPPFAPADQPIRIDVQATCSTGSCQATLYYRTTDGPITEAEGLVDSENGSPTLRLPRGVSEKALLATPEWPRVAMTPASSLPLGPLGGVTGFTAVIPANVVDTRGVDYFIEVFDGHTRAWAPGTTHIGYYAPRDGMRTTYYHVHVTEPARIVHNPVLETTYRSSVAIQATATCPATRTCVAELYYRTTTSAPIENVSADVDGEVGVTPITEFEAVFERASMTVTVLSTANGVRAIRVAGTIPSGATDTRGVDYLFSVSDGTTTSWWPGTSPVDGYVPVAGTRVGYHHIRVLEPPHLIHVPPLTAPALADLTITTQLTCATEACDVALTYTSSPDAGPSSYATIPMTKTAVTTTTGAGRLETWAVTIPGEEVTTRGVAYLMTAWDGYTTTASPGTFYWGAYLPTDGSPVNGAELTVDGDSGAHAGAHPAAQVMYPVRVLEPPHPVVIPPATLTYDEPVSVTATANCSTDQCSATLYWRPGGRDWRQAPMEATSSTASPIGELITYTATVPAADVTVGGFDYRVEAADGYTTESTPTLPAVIPNGRVARSYLPVADTFVGTDQDCEPATPGCAPAHGADAELVVSAVSEPTPVRNEALLRFDLSDIPAGHTVISAVLRVNATGDAAPSVSVRRIMTAWDEGTVRYSDRPAYDSTVVAQGPIVPGVPSAIDITAAAANWVSDPATNLGLVLQPNQGVDHRTAVTSREAGAGGALLEITHVSSDPTAPSVILTQPADGATTFSVETLQATVDDAGVSQVRFFVDDNLVGTDTVAPFSVEWDTTTTNDGPHEMWAQATDAAGNTASSQRNTTVVDNAASSLERVHADFAAGRLDTNEWAQFGVASLLNHDVLPARYQSATPQPATATTGVGLYLNQWEQLSADTREQILDLLSIVEPPMGLSATTSANSSAPSAVEDIPACDSENRTRRAIHLVVRSWCTVDTGRFIVYFVPESEDGEHGVSELDADIDGLPDYMEDLIGTLEQAWDYYEYTLGYQHPDRVVEVAVMHLQLPLSGADGFVSPVSRHVTLDNASGQFSLARHELFHRFQYEYIGFYDIAGDAFPVNVGRDSTRWWMEATAEWANHQASIGHAAPLAYVEDLPDFLARPSGKLAEMDDESGRAYGAFLFAEFLEERFADRAVIRETWEELGQSDGRTALESIEDVLSDRGTTYAQELPQFWRLNYTIDLSYADADANEWAEALDAQDVTSTDDLGPARPARERYRVPTFTPAAGNPEVEYFVKPGGTLYVDIPVPVELDGGQVRIDMRLANTARADKIVFQVLTPPECASDDILIETHPGSATRTVRVNPIDSCDYLTVAFTQVDPDSTDGQEDVFLRATYENVGVVVSDGTVSLGVLPLADLNAGGTGVRHVPTGNEGVYQGCLCEAWGIGDLISGDQGSAEHRTSLGVSPTSFQTYNGGTSVRSVNTVTDSSLFGFPSANPFGFVEVTHDFHPSAVPGVYAVAVTVQNLTTRTQDLVYRRVVDWDVAPTPFSEHITIDYSFVESLDFVRRSSDNGFASGNPLSSPGGTTGPFVDRGPADNGALFDLHLGDLAAGATTTFFLYYGALPSEAAALTAVDDLGASTFSFGQSSGTDGASQGTPTTFLLAAKRAS